MTDTVTDSPHRLIASNRVEGTAVYNRAGERLGSIAHFMVDKVSGKADYAVLSFGGLFGLGSDHYPLPWPSLKYNTDLGGYQTMVTVDQIKGAPSVAAGGDFNWSDKTRTKGLDDYYGAAI